MMLEHTKFMLCYFSGAQTWGAWANWGPCSVTCAGGDRSRSRVNSFGATEINSANCNNVPCPSKYKYQVLDLFSQFYWC